MKSSINSIFDYRETPFEREIIIRCPEEYIKTQLKHLTRSKKRIEEASQAQKGDVVLLSLESELEKFNRTMLPVTLGGGMYDEQIENSAVGHKVGDRFTVYKGEKPIAVELKKVSRTVFPEPTDDMAAEYAALHDDFSGISTVEEYCRRVEDNYIEERRQNAAGEAMQNILDYVLTHSDWNFDSEELSGLIEQEKSFIDESLKEELGKTYDSLNEKEMQRFFGVSSKAEAEQEIKNIAEREIATALWNAYVHGVNPAEHSLEQLMEADWDFLESFVKDTLTIKEEKYNGNTICDR